MRIARDFSGIFGLFAIDEETRRIDKKWNPDELVEYSEYLTTIGQRAEVSISYSGECRGTKIYRIEISPSLYMMVEKHTSDQDDDDYCDLEFLSKSESRVDLWEWFADEFFCHEIWYWLFARYASAGFCWRSILVLYDSIDICLDVMELSLESLISDSYPIKSGLKQYIHRVEKQWHIENSIEHRDYLATYCEWYEITESDSRSRDHSEVERIEVALSDRMSYLEIVYCKCPNQPREEKNYSYCDELAMVDVESHRE